MPYGFKPGETLSVMLPIDDDLPDAERIRWTITIKSGAEQITYGARITRCTEATRVADEDAALNALILATVTAWSRGVPLDRAAMDEFTTEQKYTILNAIPMAQFIGEREKKASRLRSRFAAANSAAPAAGPATMSQA